MCYSKKIGGIAVAVWLLTGMAVSPLLAAEPYKAGGITFETPKNWEKTQPASPLRLYQFKIPGTEESRDAEMAVFYFGANEGGDVEENINRWIGQFSVLNPDFSPERNTRQIENLEIHTVHIEGTFKGTMAGAFSEPKKDYAVLAAIAKGAEGYVFFKVMGFQETIRKAKADFEAMLSGLKT